MANTILIGAQWGDEGKGKIIDFLTDQVDLVVRSQGGNNAGHTVYLKGKKYVLHLVPSGILRPGKKCVIANGVVIDAVSLLGEIEGLEKLGIKTKGRLMISELSHLVLPYHRELDGIRESQKGKKKIGTTKRGIGPTYSDKASRTGIRMLDLVRPEVFAKKLRAKIKENNVILKEHGIKPLSFKKVYDEYVAAGEKLKPYVVNTTLLLHKALTADKSMLFEGAQGTFLDIDHGTYPFVTSSNTISGGACTGSGVAPNKIDRVMGVMKAYTTRVGGGPFPTEDDAISDMLHGMGREFGATTGRERRCGWFDAVATKHAFMVNGIDDLAITNLDGLDNLDEIKVCVAYKLDGKRITFFPPDAEDLERCVPVYKKFKGWKKSTENCRKWKELPKAARDYLLAITELTGGELKIASIGPGREQTILL